jgi:hypothetical protein
VPTCTPYMWHHNFTPAHSKLRPKSSCSNMPTSALPFASACRYYPVPGEWSDWRPVLPLPVGVWLGQRSQLLAGCDAAGAAP